MTEITDQVKLSVRGDARSVRFPGAVPIRFKPRGLAGRIAWTPEAMDLVEIASGVLLADRLVRRASPRPRTIHLSQAVRRPAMWRAAEEDLRAIISILSGDYFSFGFRRSRRSDTVIGGDGKATAPELSRVALFSGGLDSGSAAAAFARDGISAGYVTQYATGITRLERLLADIVARFGPTVPVAHAGFYVRPYGPIVARMHENTRRTRSFLFVSLALATAAGVGANDVAVCENGPLALNLPLTGAMVPTRHAHSQFLKAMERLAGRVLDTPIRVTNPFELQTKGQMAEVFRSAPELGLRTVSCWYQQWSGRGASYGRGHCGHCFPCVVRLASLEAAGIAIPRSHFDYDVRRARRKPDKRTALVRMLLDQANTITACRTWKEFLRRFPEVIDTEPTHHDMSVDDWYRAMFRTMKRYAAEVLTAFET